MLVVSNVLFGALFVVCCLLRALCRPLLVGCCVLRVIWYVLCDGKSLFVVCCVRCDVLAVCCLLLIVMCVVFVV